MAKCLVPDCKTMLSPWATNGVCKPHSHAEGYCHCKRCERLAAKNGIALVPLPKVPPYVPKLRIGPSNGQRPAPADYRPTREIPGTKIVQWHYLATTSNAHGVMEIRLPREPWN